MEFTDMGWCLQNTVLYHRFDRICTVHSYLAVAQYKCISYILTIFLRRDTNAHTPMLCILKQRCIIIHLPSFPLICPYTVLNTSIIARSDGGHKYIWQSRGSRLLLNFSTHCFSSNFFCFFSWGKITTLHLWDCDVTVGNFPTNESLDSYARAKRALVCYFVRCFKKKIVAQLTFWHGEIKRNQFLNVFDGFWCGPSQHVNGSFVQLLNWFGLMEVHGFWFAWCQKWYSLIGRISRIPGFLTQTRFFLLSVAYRGFISWVGECFVSVTVPGKSFVSFDSFLETARYLSFESFTKRLILGLQDYEMFDWRKSLLGMDHDLMIMVLNMW